MRRQSASQLLFADYREYEYLPQDLRNHKNIPSVVYRRHYRISGVTFCDGLPQLWP